jgi:hypothetical protein
MMAESKFERYHQGCRRRAGVLDVYDPLYTAQAVTDDMEEEVA